jgi:hypothetical protein
MEATAHAVSEGNFANEIERFREDLIFLVGEAILWPHMPGLFTTRAPTPRHIIEAGGRNIEFCATNGLHKSSLDACLLQNLVAPLFIPEIGPEISWCRSKSMLAILLYGLLCRLVASRPGGRAIVASLCNLDKHLFFGGEPLNTMRSKFDPGNLTTANEDIV